MVERDLPPDARFVRGAGYDWVIRYRFTEEAEISAMSIFGVATVEDAIREAHSSLRAADDVYDILAVERSDAGPASHGRDAPGFDDAVALLSAPSRRIEPG